MQIIVLRCGAPQVEIPADYQVIDVSPVPTRQELRPLDDAAAAILPEDPTPSLDEISQQPDVEHMGAPGPAPQPTAGELRVVVIGTDAALSAVLTRMMRADYLWVEVGFVPVGASTAARNWGLPAGSADSSAAALDQALELALTGTPRPVPLIRNDKGIAVAGYATISEWSNGPMAGEIIVDDNVLVRGESDYGTRLVPMLDAPGIVAAKAVGPVASHQDLGMPAPKKGLFGFLRSTPQVGELDPSTVATGRAVQAGGPELRVIIDGVSAKRPVKGSTFYRHLRDLQIIRPLACG